MLTYYVTAAIQDGPHKDIRTLLRERVMRPIGVPDAEWSCGYGKTYVALDNGFFVDESTTRPFMITYCCPRTNEPHKKMNNKTAHFFMKYGVQKVA